MFYHEKGTFHHLALCFYTKKVYFKVRLSVRQTYEGIARNMGMPPWFGDLSAVVVTLCHNGEFSSAAHHPGGNKTQKNVIENRGVEHLLRKEHREYFHSSAAIKETVHACACKYHIMTPVVLDELPTNTQNQYAPYATGLGFPSLMVFAENTHFSSSVVRQ